MKHMRAAHALRKSLMRMCAKGYDVMALSYIASYCIDEQLVANYMQSDLMQWNWANLRLQSIFIIY